jgi:hypothetical protein
MPDLVNHCLTVTQLAPFAPSVSEGIGQPCGSARLQMNQAAAGLLFCLRRALVERTRPALF